MVKRRLRKRNIKRSVKRNARKLKGLTAEDILLHPELVQSPQFKQLPTEKQMILMNQVKQMKALMGRGPAGPPAVVTSGGNSADSALMSRINDLGIKLSRQQNETEALKTQYQAQNDALKREKDLQREVKHKSQVQKDSIEQNARIQDLQDQSHHLDVIAHNAQISELQNKVNRQKELAHATEIKQKKFEQSKLGAQLRALTRNDTTPKSQKYSSPSIGQERILVEQFRQQRDDNLVTQQVFQNQINAFTENGDDAKADQVEQNLSVITNSDNTDVTDENSLKKNLNDLHDSDLDDVPFEVSSTEADAINTIVQLDIDNQTRRDQIAKYEALAQQQKANLEAIECNFADASNTAPQSLNEKLDFESVKAKLLSQIDDVLKLVDNPNKEYKLKITEKIKNAESFEDLNLIQKKLRVDKSYQEAFIEQTKVLNAKKEECLNKLRQTQKINVDTSLPYESWTVKIKRANTMDEMLEIEKYINLYQNSINVLGVDGIEQKQKSSDESTKNEATARADAAVKNILKVREFLKKDTERTAPKAYVDGDNEKEFSPGTKALRPTNDIEYVDISKFVYDPSKDVIPNDVLLNGVNLNNVIERVKASTDKGKFFASLAWKLSCFTASKVQKFSFYLVDVGTQILIQAVPAVITAVSEHPTLTAAIGGTFVAKYYLGKLFKGSITDIFKHKDKINVDQIVVTKADPPTNERKKFLGII